MKAYTLREGLNHIERTLYISGNSFGDQVVTVVKEHLDGTKETVFTEFYCAGDHRSITEIKENYLKRFGMFV